MLLKLLLEILVDDCADSLIDKLLREEAAGAFIFVDVSKHRFIQSLISLLTYILTFYMIDSSELSK